MNTSDLRKQSTPAGRKSGASPEFLAGVLSGFGDSSGHRAGAFGAGRAVFWGGGRVGGLGGLRLQDGGRWLGGVRCDRGAGRPAAHDLGDGLADIRDRVAALGREENQRQAGGLADLFQKAVSLPAGGLFVGFVVEFDGAHGFEVATITKHEVEVFGVDAVEGPLPFGRRQASGGADNVGHPYFGEDSKVAADGLFQNAEKGALRRREQAIPQAIGQGAVVLVTGAPFLGCGDKHQPEDDGDERQEQDRSHGQRQGVKYSMP